MAVENVSNVGDLNAAAPTGAESKSEGDDHLRAIKTALRQSFAGFAGAVLVTGADGGAANAYTLTPVTALIGYGVKMLAEFTPAANNTGASTLAVSGLAAKPVVAVDGSALVAGDLVGGRTYLAFYDGAQFRLAAITKSYIDRTVTAGTVPGVADPANAGKVFASTGAAGQWIGLDSRGDPVADKGNSGTGPVVVNYADGDGQTVTGTGNFTLSATGFPNGRFASVLVRGINLGAIAMQSTGITWIKGDNTKTTNFAQSGITFPNAGEGFFALFSYGDGTIYGKAA
jgi:hypothetical protein